MRNEQRGRWNVGLLAATSILLATGCEPIEPEAQLRFSPSGLNVSVGSSREFSGIVTLGTPTGTWLVQPNSVTIAQIEVTGPLTATLSCLDQGAGSFVLSTRTSQGMASGSLHFVCFI
jgi:hypothetical protein